MGHSASLRGLIGARSAILGVLFVCFMCSDPVTAATCITRPDGSQVCYLPPQMTATWAEAASQCKFTDDKSAGPSWYMATVSSAAENLQLSQLMADNHVTDIWLGASERVSAWRWQSDDSEVSYQGCYNESSNVPDMEQKVYVGNSNSPSYCISQCQSMNYSYAGLKNSVDCWCGKKFGSYGPSTACSMSCPVDATKTCGGPASLDVYSVSGSYTNWLSGRPQNTAGNVNCAIVDTSNDYKWSDKACCRAEFGALCDLGQISPESCSSRSSAFSTPSGRCYDVVDVAMTYFIAYAECRRRGGQLATLNTDAANMAVKQHFTSSPMSGTVLQGYWIGLVRSQWSWQSGDDFLYTNWGVGSPLPATGNQCAFLSRSSTDGGYWLNDACTSSKYFICQSVIPAPSTISARTSRATPRQLPSSSSTTTTTVANTNVGFQTISSMSNSTGLVNESDFTDGENKQQTSGLSKGAIIGIVVGAGGGGLILIIVLVVVLCIVCRRKCKSEHNTKENLMSDCEHHHEMTNPSATKASNDFDNGTENYYFGITIDDLKKNAEQPTTPVDDCYASIPDVAPPTASTPASPAPAAAASASPYVGSTQSLDANLTGSTEMLVSAEHKMAVEPAKGGATTQQTTETGKQTPSIYYDNTSSQSADYYFGISVAPSTESVYADCVNAGNVAF